MRRDRLTGWLLGLLMGVAWLRAETPVGFWRTVDDETGETKSVVEIYEAPSGMLEGRVVEVLQSEQGSNPICRECPGERKGKPVEGMVIMWDMEADDGIWTGGRILDPKKGKVYRCKLTMSEDGRLEVRGFLGFALLGRTQRWERIETP